MSKATRGWLLPAEDRNALLRQFPPRYPRLIAHHVTMKGADTAEWLRRVTDGLVLGEADDGAGVQALVVEIDGTTDRPDGSTFHITWSLAEGRRPVESNAVIRAHGWMPVQRKQRIRLVPGVVS
jgi:hypothetical protein